MYLTRINRHVTLDVKPPGATTHTQISLSLSLYIYTNACWINVVLNLAYYNRSDKASWVNRCLWHSSSLSYWEHWRCRLVRRAQQTTRDHMSARRWALHRKQIIILFFIFVSSSFVFFATRSKSAGFGASLCCRWISRFKKGITRMNPVLWLQRNLTWAQWSDITVNRHYAIKEVHFAE